MSKRYSQGLPDTHIVAGSKRSFRWCNLLTKMIVSYVLSLHLFSLHCCSSVVSPCWHPTMSHLYVVLFLSFNFCVCICLVLTLLGLHCCAWAFSCGKQGILSNCRAWDSHCGNFWLQSRDSRAHGLISCGTQAVPLWPVASSRTSDWTHVPAQAGGFFTAEPPGKSYVLFSKLEVMLSTSMFPHSFRDTMDHRNIFRGPEY